MADARNRTPYTEKMMEQLQQLSLTEAEALTVPEVSGDFKTFTTDKIAKIAVGSLCAGDDLQYGLCVIVPQDDYVLPMFFSRWEEREKIIIHTVDIMPTVDSLVDEAYRVKYIEPMTEYWDKFGKLAGTWPEEDDALRSVCSINYTSGKMPIEKDGMRLAALAPHTKYLQCYIDYIKAAEQTADAVKIKEMQRKIASVTGILRSCVQKAFAAQALDSGKADKLLKTIL